MIHKIKRHRESGGFCIIEADTDLILSYHKTKEKARKRLAKMYSKTPSVKKQINRVLKAYARKLQDSIDILRESQADEL